MDNIAVRSLRLFDLDQGVFACEEPDLWFADLAPSDSTLTVYDEEHAVTYLRMLPGMHAARGH